MTGGRLRLMLTLALAAFMLLALAACGSPPEDEVAPDDEPEEVAETGDDDDDDESDDESDVEPPEDEEQAVDVHEWRNPTSMISLMALFRELEWSWAQVEDGEESDPVSVSYRYEGTEEVDGVETQVAVVSLDEQEIKLWIDDSDQAVQAVIDGELLPGELAGMMLEGTLMALFWPFWVVEEMSVDDILRGTGSGWEWSILSTDTRQFGDLQAEVTRLELELTAPLVPEGEEASVTWGVADFGDFQMLVEWRGAERGDVGFSMTVDKVIPR